MTIKAYAQLHVQVQRDIKKRLTEYSAARGQSQGSIVEAALREYLDDSSQQALVLRELGRLRRGVGRLERNLDVLDGALAGFVQLWLAYNPPLPEGQKEAAQVVAARRFEQFVSYLQQQLGKQRTFQASVAAEDGLLNEDIRALLDMEQARQEAPARKPMP